MPYTAKVGPRCSCKKGALARTGHLASHMAPLHFTGHMQRLEQQTLDTGFPTQMRYVPSVLAVQISAKPRHRLHHALSVEGAPRPQHKQDDANDYRKGHVLSQQRLHSMRQAQEQALALTKYKGDATQAVPSFCNAGTKQRRWLTCRCKSRARVLYCFDSDISASEAFDIPGQTQRQP